MSLQLRRARLVRRRRRGHLEVLVLRAPPAVRATTASVGGRRRLCVLVRRVGASSRASTAGGGGRVRSTTSREARRRQLFAIATIRRQTSTPVGLHERRGQATGKGRASRASWSHYRGRDWVRRRRRMRTRQGCRRSWRVGRRTKGSDGHGRGLGRGYEVAGDVGTGLDARVERADKVRAEVAVANVSEQH